LAPFPNPTCCIGHPKIQAENTASAFYTPDTSTRKTEAVTTNSSLVMVVLDYPAL